MRTNISYLSNNINCKFILDNELTILHDVNLFLFDANKIKNQELSNLAHQLLHPNEMVTFKARKQIIAKKEFIASRFFIKRLIAHHYLYNYHQLELKFNAIKNVLEVLYKDVLIPYSIGISHSKGVVLFALSEHNALLGVDIEKVNNRRDHLKLAEYYFHADEIEVIEQQGITAFYRIWTLKEAFSKMQNQPVVANLKPNIFNQLQSFKVCNTHYNDFDISLVTDQSISNLMILNVFDMQGLGF